MPEVDGLCINTLRFLAIDGVTRAGGALDLPLRMAPMAHVLWTRFLKHNPANPLWFDRDRFILSAGQASILLYSLLHLTGYDLSLEELKGYRQWGSQAPGYPLRRPSLGVELTTGPPGQGFGSGVGLAMAEAHLAARFNRPDHDVIHHHVYGIISDEDLREGLSGESAALAGQLRLGRLIYLHDCPQASTQGDALIERFDGYGWHTLVIEDGEDLGALDRALRAARQEEEQPSFIQVRGRAMMGLSPGEEEVRKAKEALGWPLEPPFHVPPQALALFRRSLRVGQVDEEEWKGRMDALGRDHPDLAVRLQQFIYGELPAGWDVDLPRFPAYAKGMATRAALMAAMNATARRLPALVGGSADLDPASPALREVGEFQAGGYGGRSMPFGGREHAMGAALNGLAAHGGLLPFGTTLLTLSDYLRPTLRLAAMSGLKVIYLFTHDSPGSGGEGPAQQPVEQLASLRALPELIVLRPCDANEAAVAWRVAVGVQHRPVAIVLTRQSVPTLDRDRFASAEGLRRGAYVLLDASRSKTDLVLIATGSEVSLALAAQQKLGEHQVATRVVSMPSWELFDQQSQEYRDSVLPPQVRARLAVEAGAAMGWHRYVGDWGDVIAVESFGASGPGETVLYKYGFNIENVVSRALALLERERKG